MCRDTVHHYCSYPTHLIVHNLLLKNKRFHFQLHSVGRTVCRSYLSSSKSRPGQTPSTTGISRNQEGDRAVCSNDEVVSQDFFFFSV